MEKEDGMRGEVMRKIAITGPESTGKSVLTKQLADHYNTVWVPEYAREYIDQLGRPYDERDILEIARGQYKREQDQEEVIRQEPASREYLFCDTEAIVTKIWSEVKFNRCNPWILKQVELVEYDLYLLCYIDIPWEFDPQREHPQLREHLFNLYYEELLERKRTFRVVSGLGRDRLENAIKFIDDSFGKWQ
ncbi:MAG: ATP-binding protein [Bacteroidales bacterium]|nr:ATP-binding protein [Bacteroidales bacterium]